MRLRNIPRARHDLEEAPFVFNDPVNAAGTWHERFGNDRPVHLEIGTGKGRFLMDLAALHPEINYVGIEKYSSVLLRLADKQKERELPNVLLIRGEAENITQYFAPGEIGRLYLNFSDPWPKDRHAHRRLPSRQFLARYAQILSEDAQIEFKTDNRALFDFALEEVKESPFVLTACTFDLHNDPVMNEGNILTEYEERFSGKGNAICKYILSRRPPARPSPETEE